MSFDTFVIVDWSAANDRGASPKKDAIWAAIHRDTADAPVYLRNRAVAEAWLHDLLTAELAAGRRVLAGFDFPFGYPAGFARRVTGTDDPIRLWDWFATHLSDTPKGNDRFAVAGRLNALFPGTGPFWFNGTGQDIPDLPHKGTHRTGHGLPERRLAETRAKGAFPLWQMGGAGAVGGQAMTGMAALSRLRNRFPGQTRSWPFEPLDGPIALVEVWPSLLASDVAMQQASDEIKDAAQVRVLARALWQMQQDGTLAEALADVPDEAVTEGWILGLGHEARLRAAAAAEAATEAKTAAQATTSATPDLIPPRLRDDCFAMPQGVAWVPVDEALERLRDALTPVTGTEILPVAQADGRILSQPAIAGRSNPPTANAAVDGYGFAHGATGPGVNRLPLARGRAAAGQPYAGAVPQGQAIRILTGAILPEGVDTVVLEEDTASDPATVAFDGPVKPRANTRKAGEDMAGGVTALPAGHRLRAPDLALLTALAVPQVSVRRRLRVAVLSTGDELLDDPAAPAASHQIFDANRPMLLALARRWGHEPVDLGLAPDHPAEIAARLDRGARDADAILTSGGASAGDEDHTSRLLRERGTLTSWRIALKPGRPLALALWNGVPVFGLPGNPVAAFVCALIFGHPALSALSGAGWTRPQGYLVPAAFTKSKKPGRREYLRARLNADGHAETFASEGSGRISSLSWATGLVELPDAAADIVPGTPVRYLPYTSFGL